MIISRAKVYTDRGKRLSITCKIDACNCVVDDYYSLDIDKQYYFRVSSIETEDGTTLVVVLDEVGGRYNMLKESCTLDIRLLIGKEIIKITDNETVKGIRTLGTLL